MVPVSAGPTRLADVSGADDPRCNRDDVAAGGQCRDRGFVITSRMVFST